MDTPAADLYRGFEHGEGEALDPISVNADIVILDLIQALLYPFCPGVE